jgi:cytoskeletal protein CcmA (bactofilin family)
MIKRKEKDISHTTNNPDTMNSILEGTKIIGDIITETPFKINGNIEGNLISKSNVEIGKTGAVHGNINCAEADIEGTIEGKIEVTGLLILRNNSKIIGDILTNKLQIEEGAIFIGECKMSNNSVEERKQAPKTSLETETQG